MKVKIAVIGSHDFCQRTEQLVADRQDIELHSYRYDEPKAAPSLLQTLKPCDAILFSGSLPYFYAQDRLIDFTIPVLYLKQDETAIAITLLHISAKEQVDLNRISIDVREKSLIENVLKDLNQALELPFIHALDDGDNLQDIVAYHKLLSIQGKTDMAITSVHAVYEQLQQQQIPAYKMIDPESSILRTIETAKQQAILQKSKAAQIAVGLIKGIPHSKDLETSVEKMAALMKAQWNEQHEGYTLYTTMGNIEFSLRNNEFLSLFQTFATKAKLAFGCGETIVDATENARFALNLIHESDSQSFYMLDANKKLHGPFPQSNTAIAMKINEPVLVEMADKTKLSPANISKLLLFSQSRHAKQFTATDLALHLNVTRRTAERTLKKMVEFNYITIVGEEMTYRQGRPRALYEFNFPIF
ncbi:transcriptional regulator [Sporosarcina sp. FSL K6-3457]|uniref:transcriptional regulator n=1 Tax=Sporosarcina sp. FSL K6-3457 TaxID=2978204 RepID=UPI0030F9CBDB